MEQYRLITPEGEEFNIILIPIEDEDNIHFKIIDGDNEPVPKKVSKEYFSKCQLIKK